MEKKVLLIKTLDLLKYFVSAIKVSMIFSKKIANFGNKLII